ncbi:MAG: S8 family serine peptidase, partial [Candidatus Thermoplasmatota archaeon]|nr:S8 family serine peptidase [Candidatus Thermoplasmatota archaeon]
AVGSTENFMPDYSVDNPDVISGFSSRGWTDDHRVKPDVVAPGEVVYSTHYDSNDEYDVKQGTSMATPAVSGAASVVVEWYEEQFGEKPSPAMVRALLINTAYDLDDGNGNTEPIPNRDEGWGMVNLPALMDAPSNFTLEDQNKSITTGEENEYTINYEDPSEPLKITLTWTDKEAQAGDTWTLKNDLNLEVISPSGDKYKGNAFENGWTQPNTDTLSDFDTDDKGWDDVNNVENVYIPSGELETGNYTVRVIGKNVPADANNDGCANQDYALAFYNAFEVGPSIEIERPSGGEIWEYGNTEKIEWATSEDENPITSVDLEYSIDSGSSYTEIATGLGDTKSYDWDIPDVTSDEVVIRATVHDDEGYKGRDTSGLLTIKGKPPDPPENLSVQHANLKEDWHWMYNADHRVEADTAIGVDTQETWYGAIRTELPDGEMTDIAYYHGDDANSVKATIHEDSIEEPGNQIAETYTFTDFENDQWYEIPLKTRVELDSNHYWIVLEIDDPGEDFFPFGMYETAVEDGGYIKHSGTSGWETRDYTWALEVQVREADENDNLISWDASPDDPENVSHYNLYKSENEEGPWDNSTKIDDVDADGSKEYRYIDRGKGMADDTFWWYVVRAVGKNGIEEENEDTKQEPIRPLQIEIYEHDEEAVNGTEYSIRYNVTNIGESETTQTIVFTVDGEPIGNEEVKLGVGQKQQGEFNWTPEDLGFYTLKVASENHSDELTVSVLEDANFEVRIYDLDRGFIEGDKVVVSYMIENTGEVKDTQTIEFRIDGNLTNEKDVTLQGGDSERHNFTWQTGEGDTGKYEMEVASEDDRDDSRVTVLEADIFAVDIRPQTREVVEGEEIVVNYTVMNTKEEGDTQDIEFTIYYRDDVVYDDVEESVAISSREEHEGNFTWQTEEGDAGRYKVEVASEDDKDDSGFTVFKADLFVIDIDLSDRDFVDDEDIIVNYTVTNTKDKETTQDIQFIVYGDEEEIVYQDIREDVTLQSRESDEAEFVWGVEDIDTGKFEIKIASEDYNETSRITVWKANSFSVILEISDRHRDSVLREDQQISIEYSIKNTKEATDTQDIKFYVDEDLIETEKGVKLDPGERDRKQFNWTTEQPFGERTLTVESADDSDEVTLEIGEDPYFEVKINEPEEGQEFGENEEVTINYTVTNTGDIEETQNIKFFINGEKIDERDIQLEPNESKSVELIWTAEEETGDFELRVESRDDHEIVTINVGGEAEDEEVIPGFTLEPLIIILISIVGIMIAIYVVKTLYFR